MNAGPGTEAPSLGSDDVRAVAAWSYQVLESLSDADWNRPAGGLEWDCRQTIEHLILAFDRYCLYLANPSADGAPRGVTSYPDLAHRELLVLLTRRAGVLAAVVAASAPTTRAFHPNGRADSAGFVAMACVETLVHTDDIARGLGQTVEPPEEPCRRALARLFPWAPTDVEPWSGLQWATGRLDLPGHGRLSADWNWHPAPLTEWDGTFK